MYGQRLVGDGVAGVVVARGDGGVVGVRPGVERSRFCCAFREPRPTFPLVPYTTLFRSEGDSRNREAVDAAGHCGRVVDDGAEGDVRAPANYLVSGVVDVRADG